MNKSQRTRIAKAIAALAPYTDAANVLAQLGSTLQGHVDGLESEVSAIIDEEEEKLDNMGDGLRDSPTGQRIEECKDSLESLSFDFEPEDRPTDEAELEDWADATAALVQDLIDEVEGTL